MRSWLKENVPLTWLKDTVAQSEGKWSHTALEPDLSKQNMVGEHNIWLGFYFSTDEIRRADN